MMKHLIFFVLFSFFSLFASSQTYSLLFDVYDISIKHRDGFIVVDSSSSKVCYQSRYDNNGNEDTVKGKRMIVCFYLDRKGICYKEVSIYDKTLINLYFTDYIYDENFYSRIKEGYLFDREEVIVKVSYMENKIIYTATKY